jgi:Holliday junction resolvasome RuvABC endonuclease subunit
MRRKVPTVMGLDLSLRQSAWCVIPPNWRGNWGDLHTGCAGASLKKDATPLQQVERLDFIVNEIAIAIKNHSVDCMYIEQYAFAATGQVFMLGELGGSVKLDIYRKTAMPCTPVIASSARKLIFGKCPQKGAKAWAQARLKEMGAKFGTEDEADAFCVANYGVADCGRSDAFGA